MDDLDLQIRIAFRDHSRFIEHELLTEAHRKVGGKPDSNYGVCWAKQKAAKNFDKTLSLAICGNYPRREDFTRCGFITFSCHDRLLCPRCCYRFLGAPLADEFGDAITAGHEVFYLCLSISKNRDEAERFKYKNFERSDYHEVKRGGLATPCGPDNFGVPFQTASDVEQCRLVWKLIGEVIREFADPGHQQRLSGAVGGPELAVQLGPLRVIPHANYVVWSSSFTEDDARELRRRLRDKMLYWRRRLKLKVFPSLFCARISKSEDLRRVLSYSMKPIDLATAYTLAAERADYAPDAMALINSDLTTFLSQLNGVFFQLPRVTRHGVCHPNSRKYIGHTTSYRAARRKREAERRRALRTNGGQHRNAKLSTDVGPRKSRRSKVSRFSYWRAKNMPAPPPSPSPQPIE